ncbi:MAG TPA: 2OG-Fe(II) oxygenase, partial [Mucilaginibacter sp.]|nr:2OG-Fe(II) oxygenase [Mucilaginibacter sp.]
MNISQHVGLLDWNTLADQLNNTGYAIARDVLPPDTCDQFVQMYNDDNLYRKTIIMERYRFGLGEYKYFKYPLPEVIGQLRQALYPWIAPVANNWMKALGIERQYPDSLDELLHLCHSLGQNRSTPLILKYGNGGYNTL